MSHALRPHNPCIRAFLRASVERKSTTAAKIYEPPLRIKRSVPVLTLVSHHVTLEISSILGVVFRRSRRINTPILHPLHCSSGSLLRTAFTLRISSRFSTSSPIS
ncbi:hypothetical protein MSAN_00491000 [Mycena sanguinolenta]|uniref:Uncharacterized protein n=1 Tax=Mycena sanguinolenta TaxID=230812 RepID=A0A8H7DFV4_9AGAR|nr:hypothetical protein MSAN_00491000 [Mycena sanguinolenta]